MIVKKNLSIYFYLFLFSFNIITRYIAHGNYLKYLENIYY